MHPKGYLLIVLNTHQPFVRHPASEYAIEHAWLNEAITESYIPLVEMCEGLLQDGIESGLTFSLSPCLLAMLADPLRQQWYVHYLEDRITFLENDLQRRNDQSELGCLAQMYHERFLRCHQKFVHVWGGQLIHPFRRLLDSGEISIITSAATHAYLPLWELYPEIVALQIHAGILYHANLFGKRPKGFWLPECGFFPGVDRVLSETGIKFFFLDAHGLLNGDSRPRYGEYAAVNTPNGVAAFGRDRRSHRQVWLKDCGYPGDPAYMDLGGDITYDLSPEERSRLTHHDFLVPTGIRYFRRTEFGKEPYDPKLAFARCAQHASHFVTSCQELTEHLFASLGRAPVIVAMFDTEHFGHWWQEGTTWLDLVIRKLACEQSIVKLTTADEYLGGNLTNQVIMPSTSSWGYQGYSETWLMGRNDWIYPAVYRAIDEFKDLVKRNQYPEGIRRAALNQYLRELLLAQASDWAFLMWAETSQAYAENRVRSHLHNMSCIRNQLECGIVDKNWLKSKQDDNAIFTDIDLLEIYSSGNLHEPHA